MSKRRNYGREAWDRACTCVRQPDNLPFFATGGMWTAHKLYFLCSYLEQVARGMNKNIAFPDGLHYIDLFCGRGVSVVLDDAGVDRRLPGSAVIAASLGSGAFRGMTLVDQERENVDASVARVRRCGYDGTVHAHCGDVNSIIDEVVSRLPNRALSVAFIDPCSLDVHYNTIRRLASQRAVDLLILFSDRIDLQRNVTDVYLPRKSDKLDLFLGNDSNWRERHSQLPEQSGPALRQMFADIYKEQLAKLGYVHSKSWSLPGPRGPMFRLVFASKHELGLKYCDIAASEDFQGQRGLFG
jgi:three-Cys-motif partner protein